MNNENRSRRRKIITSTVILIIVTLSLVVGVSSLNNNAATNDSKAITNTLVSIGGSEICVRGDGGKGLDNRQPWTNFYYSVPDRSDISELITKELQDKNGIALISTEEFIRQFGSEGHGIQVKPLQGEDNPGNEFLINKSERGLVQVNIWRDKVVELKCESKLATDYKINQKPGNAIVEVDWRK